MTVGQLRKLLKTAADILARAVPVLLAIVDAISSRQKPRKPPQ